MLLSWFEDWFDSPLYERLYANRDEEEAKQLIVLLEKTLNLNNSSTILDLGCGRGRHALNLARKGYDVTGIDLSEEAIKTAKAKAEKEGLRNICFKVRDMRRPLPETFDGIVNLFTTFGYFEQDEENTQVLDSIVEMLEPGGIFVLDYMNSTKVKKSFKPNDHGHFRDIEFKVDRYIRDGAIIKEIEFSGGPIDGVRTYSEHVKLYELDWFRRELDKRNLEIDQLYGDYQGNEFDRKSSPRLMIVSHLDT